MAGLAGWRLLIFADHHLIFLAIMILLGTRYDDLVEIISHLNN